MSPNRRTRILFVIGTMGGGGAERQVVEILNRLDRSRFEPLLYLAMKRGELLDAVPKDVPIFAFWDGSAELLSRKILRWMKLTRIVRYRHLAQILGRHQIDVIYDRTYLATLDAAGGCLFRPTPRISCCVVDPQPELELHSRFSTAISWWFARRAYRSATVVLANSEGLRQRIVEYFQLNPDHVRVFYNLLANSSNPEPSADQQEPNRESRLCETANQHAPLAIDSPAGPSDDPFLIVTAGRLHAQKGHRFLLEAVDELVHKQGRSLKLVIYGQGELESTLRTMIQVRHLESHVILAGFVSDPQESYRKANLFVLPSLYEGMPNALIEAVSLGIPVLSTDCPSGPSEILDAGRCGRLVPPGDAAALAQAIADAMDHPEQSAEMARIAKKRVEQLFDPVVGIHRLEELFEQVATIREQRELIGK